VRTNEEGAAVSVDGNVIGYTPLNGSPVAGGQHTISVEKDGFVAASQVVQVSGDEVVLRLALEPTPEIRSAHATKVNIMRGAGLGVLLGGVALSAVFMVATVAGAVLWVASAQARAFQRFGQPFTDPVSAAIAPAFMTPVTLVLGIGMTLVSPGLALLAGAVAGGAAVGIVANAGDSGRYAAWRE